jgi:glycosyltransferase involved in cell wall biosynthesis
VDGARSELVVYVGRLAPSKRLDVLTDAMEIVRRQFPQSRYVLAGSRDGGWQPPSDIDGIRIIENPHEQTNHELLASAQVFANPSLTESFGITTLEAWAQGTPVVLPATPVSKAIVNDGKDGMLTGADATSIATAIWVSVCISLSFEGNSGGCVLTERHVFGGFP